MSTDSGLRETLQDAGITVDRRWTGSLVIGYEWCCSRSLAPRCAPGTVYPTEAEAWERAADHWNLHEQGDLLETAALRVTETRVALLRAAERGEVYRTFLPALPGDQGTAQWLYDPTKPPRYVEMAVAEQVRHGWLELDPENVYRPTATGQSVLLAEAGGR